MIGGASIISTSTVPGFGEGLTVTILQNCVVMVGFGGGLTTGTQRSENITKIIFHNIMEGNRKGKRKASNISMLRYAPVTKKNTKAEFNKLIGGSSQTSMKTLINFLKKSNVRTLNNLLKELKNTGKINNVRNYELKHYINTKNNKVLELLWSLGKLDKENLEGIMLDLNSSFLYDFMKERYNISPIGIALKSIKKGSKNVFLKSYNHAFVGNLSNIVKLRQRMTEKNIRNEYKFKKLGKARFLNEASKLFNEYQETKNKSILNKLKLTNNNLLANETLNNNY